MQHGGVKSVGRLSKIIEHAEMILQGLSIACKHKWGEKGQSNVVGLTQNRVA